MKRMVQINHPPVLSGPQMRMCYRSGQRHFWICKLLAGKVKRFIPIGIQPANHALNVRVELETGEYLIGAGTGSFHFRRKFIVTANYDRGIFL
jgi:hypothetical protein